MISDDVTRACDLTRETLTGALDLDWQKPAAGLEWTCWETVEHMADCLFAYTAQLAPATPPTTTYVPIGWQHLREGGPGLTIFAERPAGRPGLVQVLEVCGAMLAVMADAVPADRVSFHPYGPSDSSGFVAMGVVELLVHMHDVTGGLALPWSPPADLCAAALTRLFPTAPTATDPWATLLWATGRGTLPGLPLRTAWKWDGTPR